jgi:hypothetical protein
VFPGLGLKTGGYGLVIWAIKSQRRFFGLCLKTKHASICRLRHKTDRSATTWGHVSRSSGLLHVEASLARVSQSGVKTDGDTTVGDAHGTIVKVASESS